MSRPPFNPVVNLDELSHKEFVEKANKMISPFNPEGHPPPGVKNLIDRLEMSRNKDSQSYASMVKDGSPRSSPSSVQSFNGSVLSEDRSKSIEGCSARSKRCNKAEVAFESGSPKTKQKDESLLRIFEFRKYTICHLHIAGDVSSP